MSQMLKETGSEKLKEQVKFYTECGRAVAVALLSDIAGVASLMLSERTDPIKYVFILFGFFSIFVLFGLLLRVWFIISAKLKRL